MSIFSKRGQMTPPDDLDQGYDHGYYQQPERRPEERREEGRYDRDERYDRRDGGYGRYEEEDYAGRPAGRDTYEEDRRPTRRREGVYEEEDAPGYVERYREDAYVARRREQAPARPKNKGTEYYVPMTCQDCREDIVCALADGHAVAVGLANLDADNMRRLLDYIMGAVQALHAGVRRLEQNYILLTPAGVEVSDEEIELPTEDAYDEEAYEEYDEAYDEGAYDEATEA